MVGQRDRSRWLSRGIRSSGRQTDAQSVTEGDLGLNELAGDVDQEVNVVGVGLPVDDRWSQRGLPCIGGRADEHASIGAECITEAGVELV